MRSRVAHILPLLVILLLAALTLWLRFAMEKGPPAAGGKDRHEPDAIVNKLTINRLSTEGRPRYFLVADRMLHYPDDDSTALESLRFVQRNDAGPDTVITAARGTITKEGEEAFLYDNVLMVQAATGERPELRVHTDYLHILAEQGRAQTDKKVTMTHGKSTLVGVGMDANNKTQIVTLRSQVKGSFDAPKH
jgi:lipopolysaccharide export system protein LptC